MALYLEHFGLSEPPFRITPHTDFFFDGADRGATLEALIYAVLHDEGIVKVSGEVGSGKTMLCRVLMERLPPHVATIYLATASLAREEILHAIADDLELRLSPERRSVALRELQEHLIALYGAGRRVVILIDEAHVMPEDTLEQVRLLSNLESNRHKLLQIVLFGQPELDQTLAKTELRQLRDRITHSRSACARSRWRRWRSIFPSACARPAIAVPRCSRRAPCGASGAPRTASPGASISSPTRPCSRPIPRTRTRLPTGTCALRSPIRSSRRSDAPGGRWYTWPPRPRWASPWAPASHGCGPRRSSSRRPHRPP